MRFSYRKLLNQKIALILGMASMLFGCSKFTSSGSENTQDPSVQEEAAPADAAAEAEANSDGNKPAALREFKVSISPEEPALDGKSFTTQDNSLLTYIPENAVLAFATTRQVPESDLLSYLVKKKNLQNAANFKQLGIDAPNTEDTDDVEALKQQMGLSAIGSDMVAYVADDVLVSVVSLKDAGQIRQNMDKSVEAMKLLFALQGLELDGEPKTQKTVTTYPLKSKEDPKKRLVVTTNLLSDKMIVTISDPELMPKLEKYYQSNKKPFAFEKLGKIIPERTFASMYVTNENLPGLMKFMGYFPYFQMFGSMLNMTDLSMDRVCTAEYKWLFSAFPESVYTLNFYDKTLAITGDVTVREDISGKLASLTTEGKRFNMPEHAADIGIQFNLKSFYEIMKEFGQALEKRPLTCINLKSFNQFASDFPYLFESEEARALLDLTGVSLSITDSEMIDSKLNISYAGHLHTDNAKQVVPTILKLAGNREAKAVSYDVKGKAIPTPFPFDLQIVNLPDGNGMITNDGYYIASGNYDLSQVAIVKSQPESPWLDIHISSKLSRIFDDVNAHAELLHIEHAKKMHDMDPSYPFDQNLYEKQLKTFEEKRKNPDPVGFDQILFTLGLRDNRIHFDFKISD